jgi:hypothetical protein
LPPRHLRALAHKNDRMENYSECLSLTVSQKSWPRLPSQWVQLASGRLRLGSIGRPVQGRRALNVDKPRSGPDEPNRADLNARSSCVSLQLLETVPLCLSVLVTTFPQPSRPVSFPFVGHESGTVELTCSEASAADNMYPVQWLATRRAFRLFFSLFFILYFGICHDRLEALTALPLSPNHGDSLEMPRLHRRLPPPPQGWLLVSMLSHS